MIGTNHDEYRLFVAGYQFVGKHVTAANYQSMIASTLDVGPAIASAIAAQYPLSRYPSPPIALGAVGTDAIFACHALTAEKSLSRYVPVYAYEFNDENAPELLLPPVGFPYGAAHASELPYLFGPATIAQQGPFTQAQQQLAAAMKQDWTSLAKTGVPASGWPRFSAASQQILSLVPPQPRTETDFAAEHHCAFWAPEPYQPTQPARTLARERLAGLPDLRAPGRVEVLLDPGDVPVTDLEVHRGVQLDLGPVRQPPAQDVLLQHPVGGRRAPDDVVAQARHGPVQSLQHLQVVLDRLLEQVVVVPDHSIGRVDLAQRAEVAGFDRGEKADDKFLADGSASPM